MLIIMEWESNCSSNVDNLSLFWHHCFHPVLYLIYFYISPCNHMWILKFGCSIKIWLWVHHPFISHYSRKTKKDSKTSELRWLILIEYYRIPQNYKMRGIRISTVNWGIRFRDKVEFGPPSGSSSRWIVRHQVHR